MTRRGGGPACVPTFPTSLSRRRLRGSRAQAQEGTGPLAFLLCSQPGRKQTQLTRQPDQQAPGWSFPPRGRQIPDPHPFPSPLARKPRTAFLLPPSISRKRRRDVTTVPAKCSVSLENYQTHIQNSIRFSSVSDFHVPPMIKQNGTQACVRDSAKVNFWKHIHRR